MLARFVSRARISAKVHDGLAVDVRVGRNGYGTGHRAYL